MNNKKIQRHRFLDDLREAARWFAPGLGVKRWFLFIMAGITLLGIGFAMFLLDLYRTDSTNETLLAILSYASLRFAGSCPAAITVRLRRNRSPNVQEMEQKPEARRQVNCLGAFEMQIHYSTVRGWNFQNEKRFNQA